MSRAQRVVSLSHAKLFTILWISLKQTVLHAKLFTTLWISLKQTVVNAKLFTTLWISLKQTVLHAKLFTTLWILLKHINTEVNITDKSNDEETNYNKCKQTK